MKLRLSLLRPGITTQLFLAVLLVALAVLMAMGVAGRWSFSRGFIGYMDEIALARLEQSMPRFVQLYAHEGSWDGVRGNRRAWFHLLAPREAEAPDKAGPPSFRAPPESDLTGALFRIGLVDAQQRFVMGNPHAAHDPQSVWRPVRLDELVVGWLVLAPFQSTGGTGVQRFFDEQLHAIWVVGSVAALFAALVAWGLARGLVAPIKALAAATQRLAAGHYSERVDGRTQDEVGQLARDFNTLARTLEANERMRRDFMADVSHELRTPLAVLRGELEAMEDGVRPLNQEALLSLKGEVQTLTQLVNDLNELALADVGALVYRREPLALDEALAHSVAPFRDAYAQAGLRLELDLAPGLWIRGDEQRLGQLFRNLLQNSLRYTDPGGCLRIVTRREGDEVCIDFMDSSPGAAPEVLPKLFERFFRGEASRNRATGGSGLGLAICRSIVEAHEGRISAHDSPLGGVWVALRFSALDA
jgi:two-component system sensor histidine kinase BaeS